MELIGLMEGSSSSPFRRVRGFLALGAVIAVTLAMGVAAAVAAAWIYFHPQHEWTRGVVYGERNGTELTIDIVKPATPNGVGVVFVVSGGWK